MGYSIFVIAKSKKLQNKMAFFIEEHAISFNHHYYNEPDKSLYIKKGQEKLSYTGRIKNKCIIGFDYNSSGGEREQLFEIVKWMAEKIGKDPSVYYYDGNKSKTKSLKETVENEAKTLSEIQSNKG
jgi:hypothetical protein